MDTCVGWETFIKFVPARCLRFVIWVVKIEIVVETEIRTLVGNFVWVKRLIELEHSIAVTIELV